MEVKARSGVDRALSGDYMVEKNQDSLLYLKTSPSLSYLRLMLMKFKVYTVGALTLTLKQCSHDPAFEARYLREGRI